MSAPAGFWADAEVIHAYTRADAIRDGELIDVTETAREAGFRWPVAMTRAVYADLVTWTDEDETRKGFTGQDEKGRLWDVLWMARNAAQGNRGASPRRIHDGLTEFQMVRVPREGRGVRPRKATLHLGIGPGDTPAPVMTIMFPGED